MPLLGCMGSTGTYHIISKELDGESWATNALSTIPESMFHRYQKSIRTSVLAETKYHQCRSPTTIQ